MTVKCDGCGAVIEHSGTMASETEHFCDECSTPANQEFRICERCGCVMVEGFVIGDACTTLCEDCFEPWMDENCPEGWRENPSGEEGEYGGYYDEMIDGEWVDTGAYWTEWY